MQYLLWYPMYNSVYVFLLLQYLYKMSSWFFPKALDDIVDHTFQTEWQSSQRKLQHWGERKNFFLKPALESSIVA